MKISRQRSEQNFVSCYIYIYIIQIYSGITCGRVLNGELYTDARHQASSTKLR